MTDENPIDSKLDPLVLGELRAAARRAAAHAYAPYSQFHVGAALLDLEGRTFTGCNVENASFGLTICAERNAVGAAICSGAARLRAIAIYTESPQLTPPCGACRQVLAEFSDDQTEVHLFNHRSERAFHRLGELLPMAFDFRTGRRQP